MTNNTVATTIKQQIGVWPLAEVGARNFMFDESSLYFDAKPRHRIVRVVVTLDPSDTYSVTVVNKTKGTTIKRYVGIYADMLAYIIRNLPQEV